MKRNGRLLGLLLGVLLVGVLVYGLVDGSGGREVAPSGTLEDAAALENEGLLRAPGLVGAGRGVGSSAATGVRLEGQTIDDADGTPIEGVRVRVRREGEYGEGRVAHSDAEGRFAIDGLRPGKWHVSTWHPMFIPAGMETLPALDTNEPLPESVLLEIADAHPAVGGAKQITLRLRAGRTLTGRVVDPDGAPVARARVWISPHSEYRAALGRLGFLANWWSAGVAVSSDAAGRFQLAFAPPVVGKVRLGAFHAGFACPWSDPIDVTGTTRHEGIELQLVPAASVRGTVRHEDGAPAVGSYVGAVAWDYSWGWHSTWAFEPPAEAAADATGAYELRGLPPWSVHIAAGWHDPYQSGAHTDVEDLQPGEVRGHVDLVVPDRYVLRVRLVDAEGSPVAGEVLRAEHAECRPFEPDELATAEFTALTDDSGKGAFLCDSPGPYQVAQITTWPVIVLAEAAVPSHEEVTLVCTPAPPSIKSAQEGKIAGRVRAPDGIDLEGWPLIDVEFLKRTVHLIAGSDRWSKTYAKVDAEGYFEVSVFHSERDACVRIDAEVAGSLGLYAAQPHVYARAGASGIELELRRGKSIRGRLLAADVDRLDLELHARHLATGDLRAGTLEDDGAFAVSGLAPGAWQLEFVAETQLGPTRVLVVRVAESGSQDLEVSLPPLAELTIQFERLDDARQVTMVEHGTYREVANWIAQADGEPILCRLPAALRFDIHAGPGGLGQESGSVGFQSSVRPGETATLRMVDGVPLAGRLRAPRAWARHVAWARSAAGQGWRLGFDGLIPTSGAFEGIVPPGTYDIVLVAPDGMERVVATGIAAGRTDLDIRVE